MRLKCTILYTSLTFVISIVSYCGIAVSQPIRSPYVFTQSGRDTSFSPILPEPPAPIPNARILSSGGHFVINYPDKKPERIRFFGTELEWSSQFISGADSRILAKRLHKLGFNAVRLVNNDYYSSSPWGWRIYSFFSDTNGTRTSYGSNSAQLSRFDTLLYEFRRQGIYIFLVLNSSHNYVSGDGVAESDSTLGAQFTHFIDMRAASLHRQWVKSLLGHINPLTGTRLGDEPALAGVEVTSPGFSMLAGWRFGDLNWIDQNNTLGNGAGTICWHHSRRLDTLFSQYLVRKYGSDAEISNAWKGGAVASNSPNLLANGSFEQIGSTSWSFTVQNGATGDKTIFSPGLDSQYCMLSILSGLSPKPKWYDAYLINSTARLGQDTLYTLSFYAKIHYDPSHPILTRPVTVYVEQFQNYVGSFSATQTIDTGWKKYTFDFRAKAGGLQRLYLGIGDQMGDVMFDEVSIKRKEEYGLFAGEGSSTASIVRIKFGESDLLPRQRVRDLALFYDSLQSAYFEAMKKCISDTIGSKVLVNNYAPEWWGSLQDVYANRLSDFTQAHVNTDYPRQRSNGVPWSDSTWVMSNNSILQDASNGAMGYLSSASIEGKPFIGRYMNLVMNQNCAAQVPFFASYASLQDWDGLFFVNYANYYEDLFADAARQNIWWSIAGNPSLLVQMPVASDAFRNQRILPSTTHVTVTHDADDVLLESVPGHYSGPMGVEGYLDPNIGTIYQLRQQFDSPKHKVAAEYPYLRDTSTKVSETNQLSWSQSGGYLLANAGAFKATAGIFGADTVTIGNVKFRRLDNAVDMQSIMLDQLDNSGMLLTIAGRSQNFGEIWQYGDSSIGKHWGKAPTILSAGKLEFFIDSDSNRLVAHPLDSTGNALGGDIEGVREAGTNTFKITIDQSISQTPWFYVQGKNISSSVTSETLQTTNVGVFPNPAQDEAHIQLSLPSSSLIALSLFDDLGREVASVVRGELYQGSYNIPIDLRSLNPGHYIVRIEFDGKLLTRNLNIVR